MNVPEAHPYECNNIIPQLLSRIQKLETLVISLMSERVSKIGVHMDHSHLAPDEIKSDKERFSTLIRISPEEEYNNSSILSQCTVTNEDIITSKKRKRKAKKWQNRRSSKGNEEAEIVP